MKDNTKTKQIKIRAHHGLCLYYFQGKGYSSGFVENMRKIKEVLEEDPLVCVTEQVDAVCDKCPNNADGICTTEAKVKEYDRKVLLKCHISDGEILHYSDFSNLIQENILLHDQRKEICHDCQWDYLCHDRQK